MYQLIIIWVVMALSLAIVAGSGLEHSSVEKWWTRIPYYIFSAMVFMAAYITPGGMKILSVSSYVLFGVLWILLIWQPAKSNAVK